MYEKYQTTQCPKDLDNPYKFTDTLDDILLSLQQNHEKPLSGEDLKPRELGYCMASHISHQLQPIFFPSRHLSDHRNRWKSISSLRGLIISCPRP